MLLVYVAFPDQLVDISLTLNIVRSFAPSNLISPACLPALLTLKRTPANFISELLFFLFYILEDNFVIYHSARMMKVVSRKLGNRSLQYLIDNWPDVFKRILDPYWSFSPSLSYIYTIYLFNSLCCEHVPHVMQINYITAALNGII